jgi:DNA gyrase subunit A
MDEVIRIIRTSKTVDEAKDNLISSFNLSEIQAKAILEMRLSRLVSLEVDKLKAEYEEVMKQIEYLKSVLSSEDLQKKIVKEELLEIKEKYGDERKTDIHYADDEISIEDLIPNEQVAITISHAGYIKRTKVSEYRQQSRGGRGSKGSKTRNEDFIEHLFIAHNHNYILLFTESGRVFWLRAFEIPEGGKTNLGKTIQNLVNIPADDKIRAYIKIEDLTNEEFINNNYIVFCTKKGIIKKTIVEAFSRPRANGINAITINEGDQLLEAKLTNGSSDILLANKNGRAIRFPEAKVRAMGRSAAGVSGMKLDNAQDEIVGMVIADPSNPNLSIFIVSEKGNGKRSLLEEYRITNRSGKGVKTLQVTEKTGKTVAIKTVTDDDELMITTEQGIIIRMRVSDVRTSGRATQGVKVIKLDDNDSIADVAVIRIDPSEEEEVSENTSVDPDLNGLDVASKHEEE